MSNMSISMMKIQSKVKPLVALSAFPWIEKTSGRTLSGSSFQQRQAYCLLRLHSRGV
jgi:hypothetical protein